MTNLHTSLSNTAHHTVQFINDSVHKIPQGTHDALSAVYSHISYGSIALFMMLESTFLPFAAELGLFPAGIEAATGRLWWPTLLAVALAGSLMGSTLNYFLGRVVPARMVRKILLWCRIKEKTLVSAETALIANASTILFFGRFIPGIRHVIAIAAGTWKIPLRRFYTATLAGELLYIPTYFFAAYFSGGKPSWWTLAILTIVSVGMSIVGFLVAKKALIQRSRSL